MDLSFITEDHKEADRQMVQSFCERNASDLVRKDPQYIIEKWLNFQRARYKVNEVDDGFFVNDYETREMIAFVGKRDPDAFTHAHNLCDELNNPPKDGFISMDGRMIKTDIIKTDPLIELRNNNIVDFLINQIEDKEDQDE